MTLLPLPPTGLLWTWWPKARRASVYELAKVMASEEFDRLSLTNQINLTKIYQEAKGREKRFRSIEPFVYAWGAAAAIVLGICLAANAYPTATIKRCYDGDTCTTTAGEKIRQACIDTPELRGRKADPVPATAARDYLRELVVGKSVGVRRVATDRYGRTVAELFVDGSNVQQRLVASSHADIFWKYAHQCPWTR